MHRPLVCCLAIMLLACPASPGRGQKDPLERYIEELRSPDAEIRVRATEVLMNHAVEAMGRNGERGRNAVPALVEALKDKDVRVRRNAVNAIGLIREHPKLAVPALIKALEDKDVVVNENAVCMSQIAVLSLTMYGPEAKEAVPILLKYARSDKDAMMKTLSIGALGSIAAEKEKVEPFLLEILKDKGQVQFWGMAARSLVEFGPNPGAVPLLKNDFQAVDVADAVSKRVTREHLLTATAELGKREADPRTRRDVVAPFLLGVFKDEKWGEALRLHALQRLGELGPPAEQTAKELVACRLADQYRTFGAQIDDALLKLGPEAVGPLLGLLDHPEPSARAAGVTLLGRIGPSAAPALPKLRQMAKDRDPALAFRAMRAIEGIERKK